jgi:GTP-binding protein
MPLPRVAIVGRPNAGKSSLMNMIAGAKVSIVDPTPGVTRDRVSAIVELPPPFRNQQPKVVEFVDTGGYGVYVAEGQRFDEVGNDLSRLTESIEFQISQAVEDADLILFTIDAQAGVTPADQQVAQLLRRGFGKRRKDAASTSNGAAPRREPQVRVVATKVDGPRWEAHAAELSALGFGEPLLVSAKNNYMRREFVDAVWELVPEQTEDDTARPHADLLLAIIGKRNAGKSTLVNTLAGAMRVIASDIPGTTRDAVDVRFELDGKSIVAIDTAGLRKKKSFQNLIEHFAFDRVQRSVDRCDAVLLLIDATEPISQVDEQLAMLAQKSFKPCIIVVNKWDMVDGRRDDRGHLVGVRRYEKYVRDQLRGLWFAPISFISGSTGSNVRATVRLALELREQSAQRVGTGKLNRLVRSIIDVRGPSDPHGRFAKVYYVAQTGVEPPTITMVVNHPDLFTPNYLRFLSNRFREELPFSEVPMRIVVRARRQREDDLVEAAESGEGATIRVSRGRKGVVERIAGHRVDASPGSEDDRWLSDEFSAPVQAPHQGEVSDLSDDAFDEVGKDDAPADLRGTDRGKRAAKAARAKRDETPLAMHEGFDHIDESDLDESDLDEPAPNGRASNEPEAPARDTTSPRVESASTPHEPAVPARKARASKPSSRTQTKPRTPSKASKPSKPSAKKATNKPTKKPIKNAAKKATKPTSKPTSAQASKKASNKPSKKPAARR